MDREKVIKETKDGIAFAESRGFGGLANTMRDALALLKEQDELLRKLQKDKDKLCNDVSEWKHKFYDKEHEVCEN